MQKIKHRNILIISPFFYPEPISTGKFNTDMVLALKEKGCEVTVLCSHPLYPKWKPEKSNRKLDGINIIRGGAKIRYSKRMILRRAVLELWFAFFIFKKIFKYRNKIDLIIPVFPPSLAFYIILPFLNKKTTKIGIVHDLQEVYSKGKKGGVRKILGYAINRIEGKIFRACDKLIFLSNEMKETARTLYNLDENKVQIQYPFVTIKEGLVTNDLNSILNENKDNIVYSGALGGKQNPTGLYDFFNFASSYLDNAYFHFFSQGQAFEDLKTKNTNPQIKFHDLVPIKNIEELYQRSSVQIIPQLKGTSKGSLPSKLPNLLKARCNILFITDKESEIEKLFQSYKIDKVVTSWENEVLLSALKDLLKNIDKNKNNQVEVAKKLFSIDLMIKKIIT